MVLNKKILIVDDEKGLLDILRLTLQKEGFNNTRCAETATEALRLVRETEFDLILLDVMLPDFSGLDLCQEIRKFSYTPTNEKIPDQFFFCNERILWICIY